MSEIDIRDRRGDRPSRGIGDVFGELSHELHRLVNSELQAAKEELRAASPTTGRASVLFAGMAVAGFLGVLCLTIAAAIALGEVIPLGFAFLAIGLAYGVGAFVLHKQREAALAPPLKPVDGNDY
jgi:hypothetical protein